MATVFVDTNVFVYARDSSEPQKQRQAARWIEALWRSRSGRLSQQVLHEYYVTVTRKLRPGLPAVLAREDVRALMHWNPVSVDSSLLEAAWSLEERYRLSFWDALVAAAASVSGATMLLTEDLQEGMEIEGVTVVSPFRSSPPGERIHDR